ncbi:hypothetical protein B0T18DRAFT_392291 [Schizothecium vesticola]|uniref:HAD-like protein n=1 Tax=Schizothecium vesticola TaxID=314040 RepID=A0AA40K2L4_9PEZI|nr:hypothetical protein B0T18DRAFT_392291 [Schizothecium vesticola]
MDPPENPPAQPAQPSSLTKRSFSDFAEGNILPAPRLVIMHIDTILDGRKALTYTIAKVISIVSPKTKPPTPDEILTTVASTPNTIEIYRSLGAVAATPTEAKEWCLRHKNIMKRGGAKHLRLYPEAKPFLQCLHERRIPAVIATSAKDSVESLVKDWSFKHLIDGVIGNAHEFLENKDRFAHDIKTVFCPWVAKNDLALDVPLDMTTSDKYEPAPLRPDEIMVVSCCPYNLIKAQELGVQTCWVRMSDASIKSGGETEFVVDDLDGLAKLIRNYEAKISTGEGSKPKMSGSQIEIAEDEAGPEGGHLKSDQEGAKEAIADPAIHETQQEQTDHQETIETPNEDIKSPRVKCESEEQAEPVEERQSCKGRQKTMTPDEDVVMFDAADGEEPILATEAVENVAAGDQPSDNDALYVYVSSDDAPNDDAPNDDNETNAHEQVSQYKDAQNHTSPQTPQMAASSPRIFSSPQIPSSQTTAVLEQVPSSPQATEEKMATSPHQIASSKAAPDSQQITEYKTSPQNNNNTLPNATRDTDSPLSDIIDLSD